MITYREKLCPKYNIATIVENKSFYSILFFVSEQLFLLISSAFCLFFKVLLKKRGNHFIIMEVGNCRALSKIVNDQTLQNTVTKMQKKVRVFDQLREAMRVALPERKKGLNDDGELEKSNRVLL